MIRIREIDHVVLRVADIEMMIQFYCDVLGCTVERTQSEIGLYQLRAGRSLIDFVTDIGKRAGGRRVSKVAGIRNMDHLCLRVEPFDMDAINAHFQSHGVEAGPFGLRYGAEGEGPSIYVDDPEGNTVELKGPPKKQQTMCNLYY